MSVEVILAVVLMILLFLRQVSILKQPNKINYAPLMVGVGVSASVIHFIVGSSDANLILIFKESLVPLLVAVILFVVINIFHQTAQNEIVKNSQEFSLALAQEISQLKESVAELETKIILNQNSDRLAQEESRDRFRQDIKMLESLGANQAKILEKFELISSWHNDITNLFKNFTEKELPSIDNVIHKHIDLFRVEEQEHFNKVKTTLQKALDNKIDIKDEVDQLKQSIQNIAKISQSIANAIVNHTAKDIQEITHSFEKQINYVASHAQNIDTILYESENRLGNIKENSEVIMRQMVLSSKKMSEIEKQSQNIEDVVYNLNELLKGIDTVKREYITAQTQLNSIIKNLYETNALHKEDMKSEIEHLIQEVSAKVDEVVQKLDFEHISPSDDISQNVKILAKKSQLNSSYLDLKS